LSPRCLRWLSMADRFGHVFFKFSSCCHLCLEYLFSQ
jgi:hypothetical protein